MKSKIIISIVLAVLMLGTLATPALAAKPNKGDLYLWTGGPTGGPVGGTATGQVSLQRTRDNYIKLSLVLKGVTPNERYFIRCPNAARYLNDDYVYSNSQGVVRVKLTSVEPMPYTSIAIVVDEAPYDTDWDFGTYAISVPSN